MAIIPGNAQDGVRTGLAGRIANAVVAAFAALGVPIAVTYPVGRNHLTGMNSLVQGIVDALNIDKVGVDQRTPKGSSSASQVGTTFGPLATAGGWTDLTGTSQTFTPQSILRSIKAVLCFPGSSTRRWAVSRSAWWSTARPSARSIRPSGTRCRRTKVGHFNGCWLPAR